MTEPNFIVGEIYTIVFNDGILPEEVFGIFKEKITRQYTPHQYRRSIAVEPDYELITDYLFNDDANPDITICVEEWEIKYEIIEIFPTDILIK